MADTVLKKSNAAEKEMEARVIQYAKEKDLKEEKKEKEKKNAIRIREEDRKKTLINKSKRKITKRHSKLSRIKSIFKWC